MHGIHIFAFRAVAFAALWPGLAALRRGRSDESEQASANTSSGWGNKVVTLGDSYASGTGIHNKDSEYDEQYGGYASGLKLTLRGDNECWREKQSTPGPTYARGTGRASVFLACKGAEARHVENQMSYANLLYPSDAFNKWEGSVFVVVGGGNDIRTKRGEDWPELLERCILEVNIFKGCDESDKNQVSNWAAIRSSATSLYTKLAVDAARATIRILGYPRVMQRDPNCGSVTGVGKGEADWMDRQVDTLNAQLEAAVNTVRSQHPGVDIRFQSVLGYLNIGACGPSSTRQVNDKVLDGLSTSDASFHPTQAGYTGYYRALIASLR